MLPLSSTITFMSLIHALSTPLKVLVARLTPTLIASSKLWSEVALSSVTRPTGMMLLSSLSRYSSYPSTQLTNDWARRNKRRVRGELELGGEQDIAGRHRGPAGGGGR